MPQQSSLRFLFHVALLSALAMGLIGCGPGNPRKEIKGKITLKKEPVKDGVISFEPLASGGPVTREAGVIKDGAYVIPADAGLLPGKYKVRITAGDSTAPDDPNQLPGPGGNYVMKDKVPPEYNTKTKQEVEVTDKGPNQFDYDIP